LAKAAEKIGGYDLLICGQHAADAETTRTGPINAALPGILQVTLVDSVKIGNGFAVAGGCCRTVWSRQQIKMPAPPNMEQAR
jgi:electron transfer flavoprotein alpha/beta subunit